MRTLLGVALAITVVFFGCVEQNRQLAINDVSFQKVHFDEPLRVGYGEDAQYWYEALEIQLETDVYPVSDVAPYLYIGKQEFKASRTIREKEKEIRSFFIFEPEKLEERSCIILTKDHGDPIQNRRRYTDCRHRLKETKWTVGTALDERVPLDPERLGPGHRQTIDFIDPEDPKPEGGASDYSDMQFQLRDTRGNAIRSLPSGESVSIEFSGLPALSQIQARLIDDEGQEWAFAQLSSDAYGRIEPTMLWYNTGVIGIPERSPDWQPELFFTTFEEAREFWTDRSVSLQLTTVRDQVLFEETFSMETDRDEPFFFPSNPDGTLLNAGGVSRSQVHVSGENLEPGSTVLIFMVPNQYSWEFGDPLTDITGEEMTPSITVVELDSRSTSFTAPVWQSDLSVGRYDIVARVVSGVPDNLDDLRWNLDQRDWFFDLDTAYVIYQFINGHHVLEIAGREKSGYPYFEFADSFERHESVRGAVDPTDYPAAHTGGQYAAYYVVEKQSSAYWDAFSPFLLDISGPGYSSQPEIVMVKYGCINVTRANIWPDPDPLGTQREYEVIVDFGAVPAATSAQYIPDNLYTKGVDFIDGYNRVGFTIVDDPATDGAHFVGSNNHYDDTFNSGDNDPFDMSAIGFSLVRNWFTIRYPSQAPGGLGSPLPLGSNRYPIVLFLHGRHQICASGSSLDINCPPADRIASHRGYNYILDNLASHGYIAISVDAFDIQPSNDFYNYEARGRLILEHLARMTDWDASGSDPFGGIFQNRIDLNDITIVGHSRGGEGVAAAAEINANPMEPYGFDLRSVIAIAPTDQQSGGTWEIENEAYLMLMGAADGDVPGQGIGPYDRSYESGAPLLETKAMPWIRGANHNFFNTVWTPGSGDPYASDDGYGVIRISAAEQRDIAESSITGFTRHTVEALDTYRDIFTGKLKLSALRNDMIEWSYQSPGSFKILDDFEDSASATNSLGGNVSYPGFSPGSLTTDPFFHHTKAMRLGWASSGNVFTSSIPIAHKDMSAYEYLSFRVAQEHDNGVLNPVGGSPLVRVGLRDNNGIGRTVYTTQYEGISYPYQRNFSSFQAQMRTIRIPLQNFTLNNSGIDLEDLDEITIEGLGTGLIIIDDIHFSL